MQGRRFVPVSQTRTQMFDNIPFDIQEQIIERIVPAKSLIQFRSVSKQWKSIIDSSEFITQHQRRHNQTQPDHLLVRFHVNHDFKYVSVVDDDMFPQHKFPLFVPRIVNNLLVSCYAYTLDSSHGLLGLYGSYIDGHDSHKTYKNQVVIWNPSIRKTVGIMLPNSFYFAVGFGVCPKTYDPKVVKITWELKELKAEVFTLSTGAWRRISLNPALHLELVWFNNEPVVINGVIYWIVYNKDGGSNNRIITFDVTSELFGEVVFQVGLFGRCKNLFIYKPKESVALVCETYNNMDYDVWMMVKDGDSNCKFEKLFTVVYDRSRFYDFYGISGFRINGQPIIMRRVGKYDVKAGEIHKVYDPSSRIKKELEIDVDAVYEPFFKMALHKESLLLLNQPATVFG